MGTSIPIGREDRAPAICFVVAAKDLGLHADMAAVAALAVRRLHPRARIVVATDEPTAQAIERRGHALREIASDVIVYVTGNNDRRISSRHIKTVLRQLVKGDYLYLDSDAIAVQPLDRGWPEGGDLALARDWNPGGISADELPQVAMLRAELGWHFQSERYFNGGVIFVRDTPAAHAFYEEWHRRWQQALSVGFWLDQPALNSVLATGIAKVAILPDGDNCAMHSTTMLRGRVRVFHFWTGAHGDEIPMGTLLGHLVARFQRDGELDGEAIRRAARDNFPWMVKPRARSLLSRYDVNYSSCHAAIFPRVAFSHGCSATGFHSTPVARSHRAISAEDAAAKIEIRDRRSVIRSQRSGGGIPAHKRSRRDVFKHYAPC